MLWIPRQKLGATLAAVSKWALIKVGERQITVAPSSLDFPILLELTNTGKATQTNPPAHSEPLAPVVGTFQPQRLSESLPPLLLEDLVWQTEDQPGNQPQTAHLERRGQEEEGRGRLTRSWEEGQAWAALRVQKSFSSFKLLPSSVGQSSMAQPERLCGPFRPFWASELKPEKTGWGVSVKLDSIHFCESYDVTHQTSGQATL